MGVDSAATDRLPWLADEPAQAPAHKQSRRSRVQLAAAVAVLVVAAAGFWTGLRTQDQPISPRLRHPQSTMTIELPPPHAPVSPEVQLPVVNEVRPAPQPPLRSVPASEVRIVPPPHAKPPRTEGKPHPRKQQAGAAVSRPLATAARHPTSTTQTAIPARGPFAIPSPWNPRVAQGAAGRLVQVGAFGSVNQAKKGWRYMVRAYPVMAHLPAVVRPTRNSKGRPFFRFRVGTTSQAHSEVLCQRMTTIHLSCAVVGLPWKAKVER